MEKSSSRVCINSYIFHHKLDTLEIPEARRHPYLQRFKRAPHAGSRRNRLDHPLIRSTYRPGRARLCMSDDQR